MRARVVVTGMAMAGLIGGTGTAVAAGQGAGKSDYLVPGAGDSWSTRATRSPALASVERRFRPIYGEGDATVDGAVRARVDGRAAKRFETLDAKGDGAVACAEFEVPADERFRRFDAADGAVTRDEIGAGGRGG